MWTPLWGTAFVCSLMGYTSYVLFYKADERERKHTQERRKGEQGPQRADWPPG